MITKEIKAKAIAKLRHSVPKDEIAKELQLPIAVIREWERNLSEHDLIKIESTMEVIQNIQRGRFEDIEPLSYTEIKIKLQKVALELAGSIASPARQGDAIAAQAVTSCSAALSMLYKTFVIPYEPPLEHIPEGQSTDMLSDLRD